MAMERNSRRDQFDLSGGNSKEHFQKHSELMRQFRQSHADVAMVNGLRCDESALLESMRPLQVRCTMMKTGGSRLFTGTTGWSALVPLWKVARYKLSQN